MPACATTNECGRLRGSGTGPAIGSDCGSASATGATGVAHAVGAIGGTMVGAIGAAGGAGQMPSGAAFVGGSLVGGLDLAMLPMVPAAGCAAGGAATRPLSATGTLDATVMLGPAPFWLPDGALAAAFIGSAGGSCAAFASTDADAGALPAGMGAVWSGSGGPGAALSC